MGTTVITENGTTYHISDRENAEGYSEVTRHPQRSLLKPRTWFNPLFSKKCDTETFLYFNDGTPTANKSNLVLKGSPNSKHENFHTGRIANWRCYTEYQGNDPEDLAKGLPYNFAGENWQKRLAGNPA